MDKHRNLPALVFPSTKIRFGNAARSTAIFYLAMGGNVLSAENQTAAAPGTWQLTGNIQFGVAAVRSSNQLNAANENEITQNSYRNADRYSTQLTTPLLDLSYSSPDHKNTSYLRTPVDAGLPLTLGYTYDSENIGRIDISAFTKLDVTAWKDPYLQGIPRESTSVKDQGMTLQYNDFFYSVEHVDLALDQSGEKFQSLRRDGKVSTLGYAPHIPLNATSEIGPQINYGKGDFKGGSESSRSYTLKLDYKIQQSRYSVDLELAVDVSTYEKTHPIYGKKRDSKTQSGTLIFTWLDPFGNRSIF